MREDPHRDLFDLLERAARDAVFPGCVALVWRDGAELYHEAHGDLGSHPGAPGHLRAVARDTVYDLASLTKVLATTTLAALAVGEGKLSLADPVPDPWIRACPGATLAHLLSHSSGLPAHREYFRPEGPCSEPGDLRPGPAARVLDRVAATAPEHPAGARAVYSDLGFMILGAWLERVHGQPLDRLFDDRVAWPLDLHRGVVPRLGFHRLTAARGPTAAQEHRVAPTEVYDPALHPQGVPSHFACRAPATCAHYDVHDDNAFVMGGVAGHAGLFGDAAAVLDLARAWLECTVPGLDRRTRDVFWTLSDVPGSTRQLGWDSPAPDGSGTAADVLSARASGHTGFTGTSLWIDPAPPDGRGPLIAVLLSNRVHPTRDGPAILPVRQAFHRAAVRL